MGNVFSICLNSLHYPFVDADIASLDNVSDESKNLLFDFYFDLNKRMVASNIVEVTAEQLDGSLFGICIPEGYVMLKCNTDLKKRSISFEGFFLHIEESLRTAWMMTRWQLLFICSSGWKKNGKVWLSPEEISAMADAVKLPEKKQGQIVELGKKLLQASVPFNFALTGFMQTRLSLIFDSSESVQPDSDGAADRDSIVLDCSAVESMRRKFDLSTPDSGCYLIRCSSKTFISYKVSEARSADEKKEFKENYKNLLKNINSVWCIRVFRGEKSFSEFLPDYYSKEFDTNCVNYNTVDYLFAHIRKSADRFFASSTENEPMQEDKKSIFSIFRKKQ